MRSRKWLATFVAFASATVLPPAATAIAAGAANQSFALPADTDANALVRKLMDDPSRLDLAALRQDFPDVFARIEAELRLEIGQRKLGGPAAEHAYRNGFTQGVTFRQWLAGNVQYLNKAPDQAATQLIADRIDILGHLAKTDIRTCGAFATTRDTSGFRRDDPEVLRLLMILTVDTIKAIKLAKTRPNMDNELNEKDAEAMLDTAMSIGVTQDEIDMAFSDDLPSAPPDIQCRSTLILHSIILSLKGAQRDRVARSMLSE